MVQSDHALIREVVQHVQVQDNAIVFDHVDPKRKIELKNRLAVRSEGKTYPLSNAHFESVSRESTVRKRTEKRGSSETTVVSRQRDEEMRVVVDVDRKPTSIVLYSTRGPLTICEEQISLPGDERRPSTRRSGGAGRPRRTERRCAARRPAPSQRRSEPLHRLRLVVQPVRRRPSRPARSTRQDDPVARSRPRAAPSSGR